MIGYGEYKMNTVDIIILSWDRLNDTVEAIKSSLSQEGVDLKIIVVDQGSRPENLEALKRFCATDSRVTLICNSKNTGVPGGRNQASFAGHGKYIIALDNDAVFEDTKQVKQAVQILQSNPELGILGFRIKCFDIDKDDLSSWSYSETPENETTTTFLTTRFVGAGHAIRRDIFEKVNGYDEALFFMHEEVDLSRRFINAGYKIEYNPSVIIRHKVSPEHRVGWNDKRFYFDVRNRTYLHLKHKTFFPTMLFHTALLLSKGIKLGYGASAFKGLAASLLLIPQAVSHRFKDPYVQQTEWSKSYYGSNNPLSNYTFWERIKYRISNYKK